MLSNGKSIPVLNNISYEYFFENYLKKNLPCLIQGIGSHWNATKFWCENGKPSYDYLKTTYGESNITVYHCSEKFFDSHKTSSMKFKDYIDYWVKYNSKEDKTDMSLLYLKDWHLKNEVKDDFYEVPLYFSSDWLNEYLIAKEMDDYRFVYMGPMGSWTPLHKDVLNTFSWSMNVCGSKKWILFPPGQETLLSDKFGKLPHSIEKIPENVDYFIVVQHPGEAIFVPSQWYHQVWNLEDTISINHNWSNAANLDRMKLSISDGLSEIKKELEDLSDQEGFLEQCQDLLRCHVGMNGRDFLEFVRYISDRRIMCYKKVCDEENVKKTLSFELRQIEKMLSEIESIGLEQNEDVERLREQIKYLLKF